MTNFISGCGHFQEKREFLNFLFPNNLKLFRIFSAKSNVIFKIDTSASNLQFHTKKRNCYDTSYAHIK